MPSNSFFVQQSPQYLSVGLPVAMSLKWRNEDLFTSKWAGSDAISCSGPMLRFLHPSLCQSCNGLFFDFSNSQTEGKPGFVLRDLFGGFPEMKRRASAGCPLCPFVRSALLIDAEKIASASKWSLSSETPITISYALPFRQNLLSKEESAWLPLVVILTGLDSVQMVDLVFKPFTGTYMSVI
jgi:hypothetical protein